MSDSNNTFIHWFRGASPYINAHRGKTFVIVLPGQCLEHENFQYLINDIALLASLGIRLVLVHGARPQIDSHLQALGLQSAFSDDGLRITSVEHLPHIAQAVGATTLRMEAALSAGLPNSPMQGAQITTISGNFVAAMPQGVIDGVDLQHTGKVRRINVAGIEQALKNNALVLISCLGFSLTGEMFNLTFTDVGTAVASQLRADKIIVLHDDDSFGTDHTDSNNVRREWQLSECLRTDFSSPNMRACIDSCANGVRRAHLVDYRCDGSLIQELFSRDGTGTMVYSDDYENLRQATIEDVGGILELLEPLEAKGVLVKRSRELLETEIQRFYVMEKDHCIIACAALYPTSDQQAEIACVATHRNYRSQGRGKALLKNIESIAKQQQVQTLFVLTTQTEHWFIEQGFKPGDIKSLPSERRDLYNFQRNSKIFTKSI